MRVTSHCWLCAGAEEDGGVRSGSDFEPDHGDLTDDDGDRTDGFGLGGGALNFQDAGEWSVLVVGTAILLIPRFPTFLQYNKK